VERRSTPVADNQARIGQRPDLHLVPVDPARLSNIADFID
jgi:hypothetical protein